MFVARGMETNKVYVKAESRRDLIRGLNEKYPYLYSIARGKTVKDEDIFPEPLKIKKE